MSKAKLGRPPLKIDPEQVKTLAAIQCTMIEMGHVLKCSVDHLERHFADVIKEARTQGVMSVKRKQYELAMKGDKTMLIWFGKNYCGQRDRHDVTATTTNNTQVTVVESSNIEDTRATVRNEIQAMLDDLKSCPTPSFPLPLPSLPQ
jgi:hypothetical protein